MFRQWLCEIGFWGSTGWEESSEGDEVEETGVAAWVVFVLMEGGLRGDPGAAERGGFGVPSSSAVRLVKGSCCGGM